MVAGRSGSQKSGLALFWVAQMGLPTLYITGDMTPFEATMRLAGMELLETSDEIERGLAGGDRDRYLHALDDSNIVLAPMSPITWEGIDAELSAWVEVYNSFPPVIVVDNLMDVAGAEQDNAAQKEAMQNLSSLALATGATVIVLHHATDKSDRARSTPGYPPSRAEIQNDVSAKPQLILTIALHDESGEARLAVVKQRSGRSDPGAEHMIRLRIWPQYTRFGSLGELLPRGGS